MLLDRLRHEEDEGRLARGLTWFEEKPDRSALRVVIVEGRASLLPRFERLFAERLGYSDEPVARAHERFLVESEVDLELLRQAYHQTSPDGQRHLRSRLRVLGRPELLEVLSPISYRAVLPGPDWDIVRETLLGAGMLRELFESAMKSTLSQVYAAVCDLRRLSQGPPSALWERAWQDLPVPSLLGGIWCKPAWEAPRPQSRWYFADGSRGDSYNPWGHRAGNGSDVIEIRDREGQIVQSLDHGGTPLQWSANGRYLLFRGDDSRPCIYVKLAEAQGPPEPVRLALSFDGFQLYSTHRGPQDQLWQLDCPIGELAGEWARMEELSAHADPELAAVGRFLEPILVTLHRHSVRLDDGGPNRAGPDIELE